MNPSKKEIPALETIIFRWTMLVFGGAIISTKVSRVSPTFIVNEPRLPASVLISKITVRVMHSLNFVLANCDKRKDNAKLINNKNHNQKRYTLQGTNISPQKWHFEDDFPFPQVGYVNSLEGTCNLPKLQVATKKNKTTKVLLHLNFYIVVCDLP